MNLNTILYHIKNKYIVIMTRLDKVSFKKKHVKT